MTTNALIDNSGEIKLTDAVAGAKISEEAPLFVMELKDGSLTGEMIDDITVSKNTAAAEKTAGEVVLKSAATKNKTVMVDYYIEKASASVSEIQIDAANFAGYYYVEADTLFRRQSDGVDMPANITLPNVKIQSNFTFTMASTGDPSTFTFTMDAFPGYTYFNNKKQVLCVIQVVEDAEGSNEAYSSVMSANEAVDEEGKAVENDSVKGTNPWTVVPEEE
jgi:hypothetical protein